MFRINWTNHGYSSPDTFHTLHEAIQHGKKQAFDFSVSDGFGRIAAAGGVLNGVRLFGEYDTRVNWQTIRY